MSRYSDYFPSLRQERPTFGRDVPPVNNGAVIAAGVAGFALAAWAIRSYRQPAPVPRLPDNAPRRAAQNRTTPAGRVITGKTILISKPRAELFQFWKDVQNLPQFLSNAKLIGTEGKVSTWEVAAPAGQTVKVQVELIEERENEFLAWKSTPDSQVEAHGRLTFKEAPADRGTYVEAEVNYKPPGGQAGRLIAHLFRKAPEVLARHEMKRFKMLMETGEIATSARNRELVGEQ